MNWFCVACGGWFRSTCPHGPSFVHEYCAVCGWWTQCEHQK